jgi:hypothetical protein
MTYLEQIVESMAFWRERMMDMRLTAAERQDARHWLEALRSQREMAAPFRLAGLVVSAAVRLEDDMMLGLRPMGGA